MHIATFKYLKIKLILLLICLSGGCYRRQNVYCLSTRKYCLQEPVVVDKTSTSAVGVDKPSTSACRCWQVPVDVDKPSTSVCRRRQVTVDVGKCLSTSTSACRRRQVFIDVDKPSTKILSKCRKNSSPVSIFVDVDKAVDTPPMWR